MLNTIGQLKHLNFIIKIIYKLLIDHHIFPTEIQKKMSGYYVEKDYLANYKIIDSLNNEM